MKSAVVRGGAWNNKPRNARSAVRNRNNTDEANNNVGFRLARPPILYWIVPMLGQNRREQAHLGRTQGVHTVLSRSHKELAGQIVVPGRRRGTSREIESPAPFLYQNEVDSKSRIQDDIKWFTALTLTIYLVFKFASSLAADSPEEVPHSKGIAKIPPKAVPAEAAPPRAKAPVLKESISKTKAPTRLSIEKIVPALPPRADAVCRSTNTELGPEMLVLEGGRFVMGTVANGDEAYDDELPPHEVAVQAFAIGRCELTVGEFKRFVEETAYVTSAERGDGCFSYDETRNEFDFIKGSSWLSPGFAQTDLSPVVCVSQVDALAYIEWLNRRTGATYRLPTEAEWEYAARGGSTTTRYWGDEADAACDHANVADESAGRQLEGLERHACDDGVVYTAQVGRYIPNANGLYDMLGNVWEWTADCWHEDYTEAPQDGRAWRESNDGDCDRAVVRGGAWDVKPRNARSAVRNWYNSDGADYDVGFRLARTL